MKETSHYSWSKKFYSKTPVLPKLKPFIKYDKNIFKKLSRNLDPNFTLLMCDVVGLYTINLYEPGLRALVYHTTKYRNLIPIRFSKKNILQVAEFMLKNSNFNFLEEMLNQEMFLYLCQTNKE